MFVIDAALEASVINSIQSGVAAGAGYVTINAIDTAKAFILSKSKGSAGSVGATGTVAATTYSGTIIARYNGTGAASNDGSNTSWTESGNIAAAAITPGATDLTTKEYSAKITGATQIYCDGPCEWQVVEFA